MGTQKILDKIILFYFRLTTIDKIFSVIFLSLLFIVILSISMLFYI